MRLIDVDKLKFPNIAIFDMKLHGVTVPMVRLIDLQMLMPSVPAVPMDKLCEFLADTLHTPAPCFNNEEICPHMDFGYCRLPDAPDVKECWKKILTKWMEGQDGTDNP